MKRIEYIDAMRGFIMLLVILRHIEVFSYGKDLFIASPFYNYFMMPLFFFISGFMAWRGQVEWSDKWASMYIRKLRILLVPTLFFGLIYTLFVLNGSVKGFFCHVNKQGYWFTIALLYMFVLYYAVNWLFYILGKRIILHLFIACSILIVYILYVLSLYNITVNEWMNITTFYYLPFFYPHFIFGVYAAKYKTLFEKVLDNQYAMAFMLFVFVVVYFCRPCIVDYVVGGKELAAMLMSFSGLIIVNAFFRKYKDCFSTEKNIGVLLQLIGKRTLDIYVLHYFFLSYIPIVDRFLGTHNLIMEIVGFIFALLIVGCCLLISDIIRLSDFLAYWLFGKKRNV